MNAWRKLSRAVRALSGRPKLDAEMDEEMRSHIEMRTQANIEAGMNPEEARFAAVRQFGWTESIKEDCREQRGVRWLENLVQDIRFGTRMLRKNRGFTAIVVLTLAFSIGANTAIFTVVNALLLRPLPVRNPEELVQVVSSSGPSQVNYSFDYPLCQRLRESGRSLSGMFAATGIDPSDRLLVPDQLRPQIETVRGQAVSGNFFAVCGVPAVLGRTLAPADDLEGNPQPVVVISHGFWQRRFAGDSSVIGKAVSFDGVPFTIVGVTPPGFFGFQPGENPDLWWPVQMIPQVDRDPARGRLKGGYDSFRLMGRLGAGFSRPQAEAELRVAYQRYQEEHAGAPGKAEPAQSRLAARLELLPGRAGWTNLRQQFRTPLIMLMAAVGIVLLIACANVASLLLARAVARAREYSIRSALGAGRLRLIQQSLTESMLLAVLGGLLGLLFAQGGTRLLLALIQLENNATSFSMKPDLSVLLFTTGVALVTGLLFGAVPALQSGRLDVSSTLKGGAGTVAGGASGQRWLRRLVITQVALSFVLLVGAGLFARTLKNLRGDTGSKWKNVIQFELQFVERPAPARRTALFKDLLSRLETFPGVQTTSLYMFGLLSGNGLTHKALPEGYAAAPGEDLQCNGVCAGPRFFEALGIKIVSGRDFNEQDEPPAGVTNSAARRTAVINQSMARRYFGNTDPLGQRFYIQDQPEKRFEIVGVVQNVKYRSLRQESPPTFFLPYFQEPREGPISFVIRTTSDPRSTMRSLRQVVQEVDSSVIVQNVKTMDEVVNANARVERIIAQLGGFFSIGALALVCLGLYGVLSFAVVQRTREIGVRVALGAQTWNVLSMVLSQGLKLALLGSAIGLAGALVATRFVSSMLYGVTAADPITFVSASALLLLVALSASYIPARRAAKIDPMVALRYE